MPKMGEAFRRRNSFFGRNHKCLLSALEDRATCTTHHVCMRSSIEVHPKECESTPMHSARSTILPRLPCWFRKRRSTRMSLPSLCFGKRPTSASKSSERTRSASTREHLPWIRQPQAAWGCLIRQPQVPVQTKQKLRSENPKSNPNAYPGKESPQQMDAFRTGPEEGSARATQSAIIGVGGRADENYSIRISVIDIWKESKSCWKSWR